MTNNTFPMNWLKIIIPLLLMCQYQSLQDIAEFYCDF